MAATKLSSQDKKDLDKFSKYLVYKCIQIIVQSRLGEKVNTKSKAVSSGADWFNLAIKDMPDVFAETKKHFQSSLSVGQRVCVEISLKTSEGETMVLETWAVTMNDHAEPNTRVSYTVYNRMGILLKSLICVSRVTPAYRLSRKQGAETFVVCYRIYTGEPMMHCLGEGYQTAKVGAVPTPIGTILLTVSYRTKLLISPHQSTRDLVSESDIHHFDDSPKRTAPSPTSYRESPPAKVIEIHRRDITECGTSPPEPANLSFCNPPSSIYKTSPNKTTIQRRPSLEKQNGESGGSAESSPKPQRPPRRGAFAPFREDKESSDQEDVPFMSLLVEPGDDEEEALDTNTDKVNGDKVHEETEEVEPVVGSVGSATSGKSATSGGQSGPEDFVLVELKTPFAATDTDTDLGKFYRDCQGAPPLTMFNSTLSVEDALNSITDQLAMFESQADDYEDFINGMEVTEEN